MLDAATLAALIAVCAPDVAPDTAQALIAVESAGNPYAIGVVGGTLVRQPATPQEALATLSALEAAGWDYSVGLAQINRRNFQRLGLSRTSALDPCANLRAMQVILGECFFRASRRAGPSSSSPQLALRDAFSCYYSGNFATGYRHGYVGRVVGAWRPAAPAHAAPKAAGGSFVSPRTTPPPGAFE